MVPCAECILPGGACEPTPGELLGRCWTKGDMRLLEDLTRASGAVALLYRPYSTIQPSVQENDSMRSSDRGKRPFDGATRACSRTTLSALALADPLWRCRPRESVPERENGLTRGPGDGADQDWDAIAASMAASDLSSGRTAKDCWLL